MGDPCPICCESLSDPGSVYRQPLCGHALHRKCWQTWALASSAGVLRCLQCHQPAAQLSAQFMMKLAVWFFKRKAFSQCEAVVDQLLELGGPYLGDPDRSLQAGASWVVLGAHYFQRLIQQAQASPSAFDFRRAARRSEWILDRPGYWFYGYNRRTQLMELGALVWQMAPDLVAETPVFRQVLKLDKQTGTVHFTLWQIHSRELDFRKGLVHLGHSLADGYADSWMTVVLWFVLFLLVSFLLLWRHFPLNVHAFASMGLWGPLLVASLAFTYLSSAPLMMVLHSQVLLLCCRLAASPLAAQSSHFTCATFTVSGLEVPAGGGAFMILVSLGLVVALQLASLWLCWQIAISPQTPPLTCDAVLAGDTGPATKISIPFLAAMTLEVLRQFLEMMIQVFRFGPTKPHMGAAVAVEELDSRDRNEILATVLCALLGAAGVLLLCRQFHRELLGASIQYVYDHWKAEIKSFSEHIDPLKAVRDNPILMHRQLALLPDPEEPIVKEELFLLCFERSCPESMERLHRGPLLRPCREALEAASCPWLIQERGVKVFVRPHQYDAALHLLCQHGPGALFPRHVVVTESFLPLVLTALDGCRKGGGRLKSQVRLGEVDAAESVEPETEQTLHTDSAAACHQASGQAAASQHQQEQATPQRSSHATAPNDAQRRLVHRDLAALPNLTARLEELGMSQQRTFLNCNRRVCLRPVTASTRTAKSNPRGRCVGSEVDEMEESLAESETEQPQGHTAAETDAPPASRTAGSSHGAGAEHHQEQANPQTRSHATAPSDAQRGLTHRDLAALPNLAPVAEQLQELGISERRTFFDSSLRRRQRPVTASTRTANSNPRCRALGSEADEMEMIS